MSLNGGCVGCRGSRSPFPYELRLVRSALHSGAEGVEVAQQRRVRMRPRLCIPQATTSEPTATLGGI